MDFLCPIAHLLRSSRLEDRMRDLVDIAIPAAAQAAVEALGLRVSRSVTTGSRVRQIPRDEAEIAIECLRDWGFSARILENTPHDQGTPSGDMKRVA
jgi:hypothetical protein